MGLGLRLCSIWDLWESTSEMSRASQVKGPGNPWEEEEVVRVVAWTWGLSKWVNNGDNWGYYMAYRGY